MQRNNLYRSLLLCGVTALSAVACGPKSHSSAPLVFEDDGLAPAPVVAEAIEIPRTRSGIISRRRLDATLALGVGNFLTSVEVKPALQGNAFIGWQILRYDSVWVDLLPGDVVTAINGKRIETPDQVHRLWLSLSEASQINIVAQRDGEEFALQFQVQGT